MLREIVIWILQRAERKKKKKVKEEERGIKRAALNRKRRDPVLLVLLLYCHAATSRYTCNFQPLSEDPIATTGNSTPMRYEVSSHYNGNSDL